MHHPILHVDALVEEINESDGDSESSDLARPADPLLECPLDRLGYDACLSAEEGLHQPLLLPPSATASVVEVDVDGGRGALAPPQPQPQPQPGGEPAPPHAVPPTLHSLSPLPSGVDESRVATASDTAAATSAASEAHTTSTALSGLELPSRSLATVGVVAAVHHASVANVTGASNLTVCMLMTDFGGSLIVALPPTQLTSWASVLVARCFTVALGVVIGSALSLLSAIATLWCWSVTVAMARDVVSAERADIAADRDALQVALDDLRRQTVAAREGAIAALEAAKAELQGKVDAVGGERDDLVAERAAAVRERDAQATARGAADETIVTLRASLEEKSGALAARDRDVASLQASVSAREAEVAHLNGTVAAREGAIAALEASLQASERGCSDLRGRVSAVEAQLLAERDAMQARIDALIGELERANAEVARLRAAHAPLQPDPRRLDSPPPRIPVSSRRQPLQDCVRSLPGCEMFAR